MKQILLAMLILTYTLATFGQDAHSDCDGDDHAEVKKEIKEAHSDCDGDDHEEEKKEDAHSDCDGDDHEEKKEDAHSDCDGDDHEEEKKEDAHSDCDGDDHDEHEDDDHDEEGVHVELTPEMIKRIGIKIEQVEHAPVTSVITVPGEIQFNDDQVVHVTPSYPSKAVKVNIRQGQWVKKGAVVATLLNRETLSKYSVKAPISGRVMTKHLSSGEVVGDSDTLFTIANIATVWAEFAVPQDRLDEISYAIEMRISLLSHDDETVVAKVNYISPITDPVTRRVTVRAIVKNSNNEFRPGSYVTAQINYGSPESTLAVEHDAVQRIGGEQVLFVPDEDEEGAFKPVPVKTGRFNSRYYEILGGLHEGDNYVTHGAFALKAQMVTADMDPHAGHNH